ncbi:MAG: HD domain-containing protein [Alphaproteobacteria bacterium]|nr:HD domain-containing protein [Alphaproteobacteria bacterium]
MEQLIAERTSSNDEGGAGASLKEFEAGVQGDQIPFELALNKQGMIASALLAESVRTMVDEINSVADFKNGITLFDKELEWQHDRWFNLLRTRSGWKAKHSERVGELAKDFSLHLGVTEQAADNIGQAAKMHDIGCTWTPGVILDKPSKLDDNEFEIMGRHANDGASVLVDMERRAIKRINRKTVRVNSDGEQNGRMDYSMSPKNLVKYSSGMTRLASGIALNHHGSRGKNNKQSDMTKFVENIVAKQEGSNKNAANSNVADEVVKNFDDAIVSQLVAMCDVYDAIKNPRPYKKEHSPCDVLAVMQENLSDGLKAQKGDRRAYLNPVLFQMFVPFIHERNAREDSARNGQVFAEMPSTGRVGLNGSSVDKLNGTGGSSHFVFSQEKKLRA